MEQLEGAKKEVEQYGGEALIIVADVADAGQVEAAAEQTEREFGPIECLDKQCHEQYIFSLYRNLCRRV